MPLFSQAPDAGAAVSTILRNFLPYGLSNVYNGINTLVHAGQGTLGQNGPAPITSPIGQLTQMFYNPSSPADPGAPNQGVGPTTAGPAYADDPTNFHLTGASPAQQLQLLAPVQQMAHQAHVTGLSGFAGETHRAMMTRNLL